MTWRRTCEYILDRKMVVIRAYLGEGAARREEGVLLLWRVAAGLVSVETQQSRDVP